MYTAHTSQPPYAPPYANGHATTGYAAPAPVAYGQPPYQPGPVPPYGAQPYQQQPAPAPHHGPPLKKQKGNPVITRYPLPPNYRHPTGFAAAPYPAQNYAAPQEYQHPQHAQPPQPAYSQPAYQPYQQPPTAAYQPPTPYPAQPVYDPNTAYQQPPYQPLQPGQPYVVPAPIAYSPQEQSGYYDANGAWVSYSTPSVASYGETPAYQPAVSEDGYAPSHTRQSSLDFGLDFDFESEVGMLAEDIQPELSLGLILWHPPQPTNTPLPSVFAEAEPDWLEKAKAADGKHAYMCSQYYPPEKSRDIAPGVRETEAWETAKDDLIFVEFGKTCETVPLLAVIANRDRPDHVIERLEPAIESHGEDELDSGVTQQDQLNLSGQDAKSSNEDQSDGDQAMDMSDSEDEPIKATPAPVLHPLPKPVLAPPTRRQVTILDSLEQALESKEPHKYERRNAESKEPHKYERRNSRVPARYSRSRSPEKRSRQGSQQPKAKPGPLPKDTTQENILAALGVEGSPKLVYPTPPPALGPTVPPGNNNNRRNPQMSGFPPPPQNGRYNSFPYGPNLPPPPPPREVRSPSFDPWRAHDPHSPKSTTSQHTLVGSDFHPEDDARDWDMDATPKAKAPALPTTAEEKEGSGRKRTFDEVMKADDRRRQDEDTPRARRRQQSRQDVYSRYRR